jgi:hypothetical protein
MHLRGSLVAEFLSLIVALIEYEIAAEAPSSSIMLMDEGSSFEGSSKAKSRVATPAWRSQATSS